VKPVPGICDRCGLRFHLKQLNEEYVLGRPTGVFVCRDCYDPEHPQLDTRGLRTDDKQSVDNPRSDIGEREASRRLYAWNPVGCAATGQATLRAGRVTVRT
jgi:hypothetical protein